MLVDSEARVAAAECGARPRTRRQWFSTAAISWLSLAAVLLVWLVVTYLGLVDPLILPLPQALAATAWSFLVEGYARKPFYEHIGYSIFRTMTGLFLGILCGVPVGLLMGYFPRVNAALMPLFAFIRPIPAIAFIPLVILYFGIGEFSKILVIWNAAFLYMVLNTSMGVRAVPQSYILAGLNFGLSRWTLFRKVVLPSAVPFILTGIKTAMALSWAIVVASELIAAQAGLGFLIMDASIFFRIPYVYLGIIIIGLIGILLELIVIRIEGRLLHWVKH